MLQMRQPKTVSAANDIKSMAHNPVCLADNFIEKEKPFIIERQCVTIIALHTGTAFDVMPVSRHCRQ